MRLTGWLGLECGLDPLSDLFDRVARFATTARRNVPAQSLERAFINAAKTETMNQTMNPPRMSV